MRTRLVALAAATTLAGLVGPAEAAPPPPERCARPILAVDAAGDQDYLGIDGTPLESDVSDLRDIRFEPSARRNEAVFKVRLGAPAATRPFPGIGLRVDLDLGIAGRSLLVRAEHDALTGTSTARFGDAPVEVAFGTPAHADIVWIRGPLDLLFPEPGKMEELALRSASTWVDEGAVLARGDVAESACVLRFWAAGSGPVRSPDDLGPFDPSSVTVAVIDTGIHVPHAEFDFDPAVQGPNGQLVGWWDFSGAGGGPPRPGQVWDTSNPLPYDPDTASAHGTGTAGMAAGHNASPAKSPSACPGCNLAMAKIFDENEGTLSNAGIAAAIRWATDDVGADVISISIGASYPIPASLGFGDVYDAIDHARAQGTLVVIANGNGWLNAGVPGQPGGLMPIGNSLNALAVGADGTDGYTATTDPELVSHYTVVTSANLGVSSYHEIAGTSFSAPFVAGAAGRLIAEAKGLGRAWSPDSIETLLKHTARDTTTPPTFEGFGMVDLDTLADALDHLRNATEPPVHAANSLYVDSVVRTQNRLWTETMPRVDAFAINPLGVNFSGPGAIGTSAPEGITDAEVYEVVLAAGETREVGARYAANPLEGVQDFDLAVFPAGHGPYAFDDAVATSGLPAGEVESVAITNATAGPVAYHVVLWGWSIVGEQGLDLIGLDAATLHYDGLAAYLF